MSQAECDELRVLIYVLSSENEVDTQDIMDALGLSDTDVISAVSFWRGAGLISSDKVKKAAKPKESEPAKENKEKEESTKILQKH